jgi:hypothetical protein
VLWHERARLSCVTGGHWSIGPTTVAGKLVPAALRLRIVCTSPSSRAGAQLAALTGTRQFIIQVARADTSTSTSTLSWDLRDSKVVHFGPSSAERQFQSHLVVGVPKVALNFKAECRDSGHVDAVVKVKAPGTELRKVA